jgi:hypothetical protein
VLAAVGWGASGERRWTKVVAGVGEHGGEGRNAAVAARPASGEDGGGDGCVVTTGRTTVGRRQSAAGRTAVTVRAC